MASTIPLKVGEDILLFELGTIHVEIRSESSGVHKNWGRCGRLLSDTSSRKDRRVVQNDRHPGGSSFVCRRRHGESSRRAARTRRGEYSVPRGIHLWSRYRGKTDSWSAAA